MRKAAIKRGIDYLMKRWVKIYLVALIFYLIITTFIIQSFYIPSPSMEPTLKIGDKIFASKFIYGFTLPVTNKKIFHRYPRRGDIIIFSLSTDAVEREKMIISLSTDAVERHSASVPKLSASPGLISKYYIKRVIGLPRELLEIKKGKIYINNKPMEDKSQMPCISKNFLQDYYGPVDVPPQAFFVMGDNRANSCDSRVWGPLEEEYIRGKALFIYWPPSRLKIIK